MFSRKPARHLWPTSRSTQRIVAGCAQRNFTVSNVLVCDTSWLRTRGLLGHTSDLSALIFPCASIHTLGMARKIDVIYLSAAARVVRIVKELRPLRASFGPRGSYAVLEVPSGVSNDLEIGDQIVWSREEMDE